MPHQTKPGDPVSYSYGHNLGDYPEIGQEIAKGNKPPSLADIAKMRGQTLVGTTIVDTKDADSFINQQNQIGVSGGVNQLPTNLGSLASFLPQAQTIFDTLYSKSPEEQEREDRINTGMMMLNFFTKMGAEASKPGATALGAANIAGADTASMYIKQVNAERARRDAEKKGVVGLATQLMGKKTTTGVPKDFTVQNVDLVNKLLKTNLNKGDRISLTPSQFSKFPLGTFVGFNQPKSSTVKQMGAGDAVNYMSESQATQYLLNKGLKLDSPTFKSIRNRLITDDTNLIGTPLIISGKPAEINFTSKDGEVIDAVISQIKGSEKTDYAVYKTKKLQEIAKTDADFIEKVTRFLPNLQNAMNVLLDPNVKTGGIEGALLPAKQFLKSMFGFKDEDLKDQEFLRSISFQLAPQMRPKGSGSTSDMEFKAYQQAILELGNTKFANYINLYSLKKMTENAIQLNQLEAELLVDPKNYSKKYINEQIRKFDKGIFDKFSAFTTNDEGVLVEIYENDELKEAAFAEYWENLPNGSVFRNADEKGQKIIEDAGPYIVKGLR
jgi:hypothetical protein